MPCPLTWVWSDGRPSCSTAAACEQVRSCWVLLCILVLLRTCFSLQYFSVYSSIQLGWGSGPQPSSLELPKQCIYGHRRCSAAPQWQDQCKDCSNGCLQLMHACCINTCNSACGCLKSISSSVNVSSFLNESLWGPPNLRARAGVASI